MYLKNDFVNDIKYLKSFICGKIETAEKKIFCINFTIKDFKYI